MLALAAIKMYEHFLNPQGPAVGAVLLSFNICGQGRIGEYAPVMVNWVENLWNNEVIHV